MIEAGTMRTAVPDRRFDRLAALVSDEIGVKLPASKRQMVESRLRRRMLNGGFRSLDDYLAHLFERGGLAEERDAIFDAVTTNKTDFFREPAHYRYLAEMIVPTMRRARRPMFKVWSAAASNGSEAWSAAMVLADIVPEVNWGILGTDINTQVLEDARRAIYPASHFEPVPQHLRERHVMIGTGDMAGEGRIHPSLRARVKFARLNLMDDRYPVDRDVDVIFLRNVLIYFGPSFTHDVLESFAAVLHEDGYLMLGSSEQLPDDTGAAPRFKAVRK